MGAEGSLHLGQHVGQRLGLLPDETGISGIAVRSACRTDISEDGAIVAAYCQHLAFRVDREAGFPVMIAIDQILDRDGGVQPGDGDVRSE